MNTSVPEHRSHETSAHDLWFRTTHWSVVLEAGRTDSAEALTALGKLCRMYWYPLYAYVRRSGHTPEDAQDLTQEFFARLIAKDYLHGLDPQKGKFRTFLLVAIRHFLTNEWNRVHRQKRGGGREVVSLDEAGGEERYQSEFADQNNPEKVYEQCWANTLLEHVLQRLGTEMEAEGKGKLFGELKCFLGGSHNASTYPEAARRLGLSEGTLRVNVHRLRQRYRDLLRMEIAPTVDGPGGVDEEIRHLFAALS